MPCYARSSLTHVLFTGSHGCIIFCYVVLFIMAPQFEKSPANIASKRPCLMIDLDAKLKVIKDYGNGKSAMAIA